MKIQVGWRRTIALSGLTALVIAASPVSAQQRAEQSQAPQRAPASSGQQQAALPRLQISGISSRGYLGYKKQTTIQASIKNVGNGRLTDAVWTIQTPAKSFSQDDGLAAQGHTGALEPNASLIVSAAWMPKRSGPRRIEVVMRSSSDGAQLASLAQDLTVNPDIVQETLHNESYGKGGTSLSADESGRACGAALTGRRYPFEGVIYNLNCAVSGGRFTIDVFKNVTLLNGWKVERIWIGAGGATLARWEVAPAGTSAYGRVHVALEPGQSTRLDIRVEVEGPVDYSWF